MPQTVEVVCRYCGASREVPHYYAGRYSTCGAGECRAKLIAERAAAAKAANTGRVHSEESRRRRSEATRGKPKSPEHVAKVVAARKARGQWFSVSDIGERISAAKTGKAVARLRGPGNGSWKGGLSKLPQGHRSSMEYSEWRSTVLGRANHACERCGATKHVIAHHIAGWHEAPGIRADPANGKALCRSCHALEHKLIDNLPRVAGPWPDRPSVTTILCRFCNAPRHVETRYAKNYSTCGSAECVRKRRSSARRREQGGAANPNYRHGQWASAEKTCAVCGTEFVGPQRRKYCSSLCAHTARRLSPAVH